MLMHTHRLASLLCLFLSVYVSQQQGADSKFTRVSHTFVLLWQSVQVY